MIPFEQFELISRQYVRNCNFAFQRASFNEIDWKSRMIGIVGARGVGKTTLMLQRLKEISSGSTSGIYLTLDHPLVSSHSLYEIAEHFVSHGGGVLFLDEVHRYENWSAHLKTIYDAFPKLKIVFSGSSALHLHKGKGDLSRRATIYKMPILSFREFLEMETKQKFSSFTLQEISADHVGIAETITQKIKPLKYFNKYIEYGCYPFYLEGEMEISAKLQSIVNQVIEIDLVIINNIEGRFIHKLKKLLAMISMSLPYQPNLLKLSEVIGISRPLLYQYLEYLQDANLIYLLRPSGKGYAKMIKSEKIYLDNTNFIHALCGGKFEVGTMRETFFISQVKMKHQLEASPNADFFVDDKYIFEVGGKNKSTQQLKQQKNSFVVSDNLEIGINNRIPLWLMGFLK